MNKCDKCGENVQRENDALHLTIIASRIKKYGSSYREDEIDTSDTPFLPDNVLFMMTSARHLLPIDECEGSPSRAQYLEGQPRDGKTKYSSEDETIYRAAYERLKKEVGTSA